MSLVLRVVFCLVLATGGALAQDGSVETLGAPTGPSSGEALPDPTLPEAPPAPPPCGTQPITLARMPWPSAALLAEIHSRILAAELDCEVRLQEGDLAVTASAMSAAGQPAVAPELWISRVAEVWNAALEGQKVRQAGPSYLEPLFEGWFIPDYVVASIPEARTIEGLKARIADLAPAGGGKPRFLSCPPDWACSVVNRNLMRAQGLDALFEIVEPANRFELDQLIAEAVGRREPILFYYWQPNAILAQFAFDAVEFGTYDPDAFLCAGRLACASPGPTGFAPDPVIVAVSEWVFLDAPQVASYFARARMPLGEMNAMLQQLSDPGATVETVAERFVAERGELWGSWFGLGPPPAADPAVIELPPATGGTTSVPLDQLPLVSLDPDDDPLPPEPDIPVDGPAEGGF